MAWSWFRQNGVVLSHPPAGNASRWALTRCVFSFERRAVQYAMNRKSAMKKKILSIFLWLELGLEAVLCTLLGVQAIRYWLHPLWWGWPQEVRERGLILITFAAIMLILSVILIKAPKLGLLAKISGFLFVIVSTLGLGLFILFYLPISPGILQEILKQGNYSPQDVPLLTDCEKVEKFAAVGSNWLDIHHGGLVLGPTWLHQSLETIPQDVLIDCFQNQIVEQETLINANSKPNENEVAVRKLHALVFEAKRLRILSQPELLNQLRIIACNKDIDYFGRLTIEYYMISNNKVPPYDYYSDEGEARLHKEVCE